MNAEQLTKFFFGGNQYLQKNKMAVDALNVFPVPDGDTGTNMSLTMQAAVKEITPDEQDIGQVAQAVARGSLMGARGNSGVILSQLFRGLAQGTSGAEINAKQLATALQKAVDMAYKAVMRPVEGTILTVAKACAAGAAEAAKAGANSLEVMEAALNYGEKALAKTPEQLPVLKEAGVVDAGGKGLLVIFNGGIRAIKGEDLDEEYLPQPEVPQDFSDREDEPLNLTYQYCTEFILKGNALDGGQLRLVLEPLGDSLLVVGTETLLKVHIHTNNPGKVLEFVVDQGTIHDFKMDNMEDQHRSKLLTEVTPQEKKPLSVVAVAVGEGLTELLENLGVDKIISGGQSMNPSTEDLVAAVNEASGDKVLILPNNSNIILAAQQAAQLAEKDVVVVPSKTFPQGITAMLSFDGEKSIDNNRRMMTEAMGLVTSGEITYAVRDSSVNGSKIKAGDILGIKEGKIEIVSDEVAEVLVGLLIKMVDEDAELLTLYYGQHVKQEDAEELAQIVTDRFPDLEIEIHFGGQPLYYYIISVE
ncbi:DAK2 domain-containing protein [Metallumcola ferriviriculae]|uniref:DAK2 domain-containing protein n=1 Tax=Metallumcola ferriviriculae TaxID=3039180 RepID=A0AAU0UNQ9_9FIRM|nr:DAK2 domain-containing protein [Desulfitibacteraceae bacterium MK1]